MASFNLNADIEISMAKRSRSQGAPVPTGSVRVATETGVEYRFHRRATGVDVQCVQHAGSLSRIDQFGHFNDAAVLAEYADHEQRRLAEAGLAARLTQAFGAVAGRSDFGDATEEPLGLDYATRVLNIVQRIHGETDQAGVLDLVHQATRAVGVDGSIYASTIPEPGSSPTKRVLVCGKLAGHIAAWSDDLLRDWMGSTWSLPEPVMASALPQSPWLVDKSRMTGSRSAFVIPMASGGDRLRFATMVFVPLSDGLFETEHAGLARLLARSLAGEVNDWWFHESRAALQRDARLDAVDLGLLAMQRAGQDDSRMSEALGLTPRAVARRWRSLLLRLQCADRRGAAQRAVEYGLV